MDPDSLASSAVLPSQPWPPSLFRSVTVPGASSYHLCLHLFHPPPSSAVMEHPNPEKLKMNCLRSIYHRLFCELAAHFEPLWSHLISFHPGEGPLRKKLHEGPVHLSASVRSPAWCPVWQNECCLLSVSLHPIVTLGVLYYPGRRRLFCSSVLPEPVMVLFAQWEWLNWILKRYCSACAYLNFNGQL